MFELYVDDDFVSDRFQETVDSAYSALLKNTTSGFHRLTERLELWQESQKRGDQVRQEAEKMVVVGIGGSSLGGRAIYQALGHRSDRELEFLDNVDGWQLDHFFAELQNVEKVHWVLISKSGGTLETLSLASSIHQFLQSKGLSLANYSTVISEEKSSPLVDWAKENKVPCLPVPLDVGGRFSVLTPVGILPAAFLGLSIEEMRLGAESALKNEGLTKQLTAFTLQSFEKKAWMTAFWFYSSRMFEFGRWLQQLWAESLAKSVNREGKEAPQVSVPLPLLGSTDQHSVLQQLAEGRERKSLWFFRVSEGEQSGELLKDGLFSSQIPQLEGKPIGAVLAAFSQSTREALKQTGADTVELRVTELNEHEIGALLMTMMLVVGTLGECLNIDAFNQPGVELGKQLVKKYL